MKDDIRFKRLGAYLLDMVIVTLVMMIISNVNFFNPTINEYNQAYNNYKETYEKYQKKEIDDDKYKELYYEYNYQLSRYGACYTIYNISIVFIYFGLFQYLNKGQTLGKKIFNIKCYGYKNKKLNIFNYIIRLLILNGTLYNIVTLVALLFNNKVFFNINYYGYQANYLLQIVIICTIFINKDNRGLHDILSGTIVKKIEK